VVWAEKGVPCGTPDPIKGIETFPETVTLKRPSGTCGTPDPIKGIETQAFPEPEPS